MNKPLDSHHLCVSRMEYERLKDDNTRLREALNDAQALAIQTNLNVVDDYFYYKTMKKIEEALRLSRM